MAESTFILTNKLTSLQTFQQKVYDEECANYPGFKTVFRSGGTGKAGANDSASSNKEDHLDFENYRHVCHKWHFKITKSIINCLESGDYLLIRNSLIILTKIAPFFPRIQVGEESS